ncbi:MAG: hypothetical protein HUJ90_01560, partial [Bacteroidales bacterium]|nr:hypothetical protein [Bacteroidales bacterium]
MKRFFTVLTIACAMLFSVSANAQNGPRGQLKAGAARVDITPEESNLRQGLLGIVNHTHVRAIVFSNGNTTAGFVNMDGNCNGRIVAAINERAEKELGIPAGNLLWSGTHSHSSGNVMGDDLTERTWQAVKKAYENMIPAKVGFGNGVCYLNVKRDLFDPERG